MNCTKQLNFIPLCIIPIGTKGETQFTSASVMQKHQLGTPRNVSKNKTLLINNDSIHEINSVFEFVDPAFELWFKKQFFNQSFNLQP